MKEKLRVLQFGKFFPPHIGGIETFMRDLIYGLVGKGITCDVLCSNKSFHYKEEVIDQIRVMRTRSIGIFFSLSISPQLITKFFFLKNSYDIIHLHHPDPMSALAIWLTRPKIKILITWHNDIIRQKKLLFFFEPLQRWLMKKASVIVATSPAYLNGSPFLTRFQSKVKIIPLGIHAIPEVDPVIVQQYKSNFPGKTFFIFSLGRLVEYKGFRYLIQSAKHLPDNYQIIIGGSGKLYNQLQDLISQSGVDKSVKLLGKISSDELNILYNLSDIFCLASITRNEGFGIVLLEAMSVGKPLVATDLVGSGVPWVNQDRITGLNVPAKDSHVLASAIRSICENPDIKGKFGNASRSRFQNHFTIDKMVESYMTLYEEILKDK
jgi:rhamnosyl/mannosyltransferase